MTRQGSSPPGSDSGSSLSSSWHVASSVATAEEKSACGGTLAFQFLGLEVTQMQGGVRCSPLFFPGRRGESDMKEH